MRSVGEGSGRSDPSEAMRMRIKLSIPAGPWLCT